MLQPERIPSLPGISRLRRSLSWRLPVGRYLGVTLWDARGRVMTFSACEGIPCPLAFLARSSGPLCRPRYPIQRRVLAPDLYARAASSRDCRVMLEGTESLGKRPGSACWVPEGLGTAWEWIPSDPRLATLVHYMIWEYFKTFCRQCEFSFDSILKINNNLFNVCILLI